MQAGAHFDGSRRIASCFGSSKPSRSTGSAAPTSPKRVFSACVTASLKRSAVTLALPSSNALPRKRKRVTRCEGEESEELRAHVAAEEHVGRVRHASECHTSGPGAARETCGGRRAVGAGVASLAPSWWPPSFLEKKLQGQAQVYPSFVATPLATLLRPLDSFASPTERADCAWHTPHGIHRALHASHRAGKCRRTARSTGRTLT